MIYISNLGALNEQITFDNMMLERQSERIRRLQSSDPYIRDAALREYQAATAGREARRAASDARRQESALRRESGAAAAMEAYRRQAGDLGKTIGKDAVRYAQSLAQMQAIARQRALEMRLRRGDRTARRATSKAYTVPQEVIDQRKRREIERREIAKQKATERRIARRQAREARYRVPEPIYSAPIEPSMPSLPFPAPEPIYLTPVEPEPFPQPRGRFVMPFMAPWWMRR